MDEHRSGPGGDPPEPTAIDVEKLFQCAADLPPSERARFLDTACAGHPAIRAELETLLSHLDRAGSEFLGAPLIDLDELATPTIPERIGPYVVLEPLGEGGMGLVLAARDPGLDRRIAIKVLPPLLARNTTWQEQIRAEARLLASINHPNIATVFSLEEADGEFFLTMELVSGETLAERLSRGPLSLSDTLWVAKQIASALEAAHRRGVVHRDLKPGNVMITDDGRVKVLDFGIAGSTRAGSGHATGASSLGTPGYMSPEQIRGEPADPRSDVWAFGCLLYECLAGRPAFPVEEGRDVLAATLEGEIDRNALPASVPARVRGVLDRCLVPDLDRRLAVMPPARRQIEEEIAFRSLGTGPTRPSPDVPTNLPVSLTTFVGRDEEIASARALLASHRVVTLTGPGGCGKSRLALELARHELPEWADGAWFVELAPIVDPAAIPTAVASVLGIREHPGHPVEASIETFFRDRHLLLVLNNCEHLVTDVAQLVARFLRGAAGVRVLATSRERLAVEGEAVYPVPSLQVPPDGPPATLATLTGVEAVRLFTERARAARPGFSLTPENADAVVQICRRLDGIPLALELAAARVAVLSPRDIAARLTDRFRLLTSGSATALPRHQTLDAAIAWSYHLLTGTERRLFQRLAVFAGDWTLHAAEAVCAGDDIDGWAILDLHSRLVEKSLVEVESSPSGTTARYRMLETIRAYARERLDEADEVDTVASRHAAHFLELAEEAEAELRGPEQGAWLVTLETEHGNLRRALYHAIARGSDDALRLVAALGRFWAVRGHWKLGRELIDRALAATPDHGPSPERARVIGWAGTLARVDGDLELAETVFDEVLRLGEALADDTIIATALSNLGHVAHGRTDFATARQRYEACLAVRRRLGVPQDVATSLTSLLNIAVAENDLERARALIDETLDLARSVGDLSSTALTLHGHVRLLSSQGRYDEALATGEEALALARGIQDRRFEALLLNSRASIAFARGDYEAARADYEICLRIRTEFGEHRLMGQTLTAMGYVACVVGDLDEATSLLDRALEVARRNDDRPGVAYAITGIGYVALLRRDPDGARSHLVESIGIRRGFRDTEGIGVSLEGLAQVASAAGDHVEAVRLYAHADAIRDRVPFHFTVQAQEDRRRCMAAARAALGDGEVDRIWDAGKAAPLEPLLDELTLPGGVSESDV